MTQYSFVLLPRKVPVIFQHHLIPGQRTGFIRAEYIHGSHILNGVQITDDHFFGRHSRRTLGKTGGHYHGEHFRGKPNGDGNGE